MAPVLLNNNSSNGLTDNKLYDNYFPKFIIILSTLYILSFLIMFLVGKCRRFRVKKKQQEKKRLQKMWETNIQRQKLNDSVLLNGKVKFPQSTYKKSSCSNISSTSPTLNPNMTLSYINSNPSFQSEKHGTIDPSILGFSKEYCHVNSNKESVMSDVLQVRLIKKSSSRNGNYWISNAKRLTLLWDWGVSVGYIEYDHAKKLEALITKLSSTCNESPLLNKEDATEILK